MAENSQEIPVKAVTYTTYIDNAGFTESKILLPLEPHHMVVKVRYVALNPVDFKLMHSPVRYALPGQKGIGREYSGEVLAVGSSVTRFREGDAVCGMCMGPKSGALRTNLLVDTEKDVISTVPGKLPLPEAASYQLSFGTAFQCLEHVNWAELLEKNAYTSVLVLGGATMAGQFTIQLCRQYFHVSRVVATCSARSEAEVRELGADFTVDYTASEPLDAQVAELVSGKLEGKKFDAVIDCVGGKALFGRLGDILKPRKEGAAYVTIVGDRADAQSVGGPLGYLYERGMIGRKLFGSLWGVRYHVVLLSPGDWVDVAHAEMEKGTYKVKIDEIVPWTEWKEAIVKVGSKKARGKVVLEVTE